MDSVAQKTLICFMVILANDYVLVALAMPFSMDQVQLHEI